MLALSKSWCYSRMGLCVVSQNSIAITSWETTFSVSTLLSIHSSCRLRSLVRQSRNIIEHGFSFKQSSLETHPWSCACVFKTARTISTYFCVRRRTGVYILGPLFSSLSRNTKFSSSSNKNIRKHIHVWQLLKTAHPFAMGFGALSNSPNPAITSPTFFHSFATRNSYSQLNLESWIKRSKQEFHVFILKRTPISIAWLALRSQFHCKVERKACFGVGRGSKRGYISLVPSPSLPYNTDIFFRDTKMTVPPEACVEFRIAQTYAFLPFKSQDLSRPWL